MFSKRTLFKLELQIQVTESILLDFEKFGLCVSSVVYEAQFSFTRWSLECLLSVMVLQII